MTELIAPESASERIEAERRHRPARSELVLALIERDGDECRYCHRDFSVRERTIDHVYPQGRAFAEGWTYEQVWHMDNLALSCKPCNAKKSDRLLDENGNIPVDNRRTFRYRRDRRATRPSEPCGVCDNGHNLFIDEICAQCGVSAQQFPRSARVRSSECSHDITWCWACSIGIVERTGSLYMLFGIDGAPLEGQEDGYIG